MTRKDFIIIAEIIRDMPDHAATLRTQKESCARAFAKGLRSSNSNFKAELFYQAAMGVCPVTARTCRDYPDNVTPF